MAAKPTTTNNSNDAGPSNFHIKPKKNNQKKQASHASSKSIRSRKTQGNTYITRAPIQLYFRSFNDHCTWGNNVRLYKKQVANLKEIIAARKPHIDYYICHISKTFATQRMARTYTHYLQLYVRISILFLPSLSIIPSLSFITFRFQYFSTGFTNEYLHDCIDPKLYDLPITSGDGNTYVKARLIKGIDNRATITKGWADFFHVANMKEGETYAFAFRRYHKCLRLTVHTL